VGESTRLALLAVPDTAESSGKNLKKRVN